MNSRIVHWGLAAVGLTLMALFGCDYSSPETSISPAGSGSNFAISPREPMAPGVAGAKAASVPRATEERTAILESSMTLIERAAVQPGGKNFELAVKKLNQYFQGTPLSSYQLPPGARRILGHPVAVPDAASPREQKLEPPGYAAP